MRAAVDGTLAPIPFEIEQNPEFHMGGGGLYSTAADYIKFTQMILNKGRGNGNQLLKPETVALMGQNHIGDLTIGRMPTMAPMYTNDVDLYPDIVKKWGLSFPHQHRQDAGRPQRRQPRLAGLANTYFWIDPARNVTGVILMQLLPFADAKALEAFAGIERGVYAGLDGDRRRRKERMSETVIASEAKQSIVPQKGRMDCFVASLLAMTMQDIAPRSRSKRA